MSALFDNLPCFPPALPDDELRILAAAPNWPDVMEVPEEDEVSCRRLERRGLIKIHRWKSDDIATRPTFNIGKLSNLTLVGE